MPLETLEEIRLLSNLETHRHKLMQIVLFGQPELERKLQSKSIRQLRERITHSFDLDPLTPEDVREYLHFRLQQAGCPWPQLFAPRAEKLLAVASGGLTRRVNILADKALLAAYADPSMRQEPRNSAGEILPMVLPRHVKTAIEDSGYRRWRLPQLPLWIVYSSTVLATLVLIAVFVVQGGWLSGESTPAVTAQVSGTQVAAAPAAIESVAAPPAVTNSTTATALVQTTASSPAALPATAKPEPMPTPPAITELVESVAHDDTVTAPAAQPEIVVSNAAEHSADTVHETATSGERFAAPVAETVEVVSAESVVTPPLASETGTSGVIGLAGRRSAPSAAWVADLPNKEGYTIQLYAVPTQQPEKLEEFLEFLELTNLLDRSYICVISGNSRRPEQWLVMHDEFPGVSAARRFISDMPPYLAQYQPYIRNLNDIACAE
jgi:hypothetical protein